MSNSAGKNIIEKIWHNHLVTQREGHPVPVGVDGLGRGAGGRRCTAAVGEPSVLEGEGVVAEDAAGEVALAEARVGGHFRHVDRGDVHPRGRVRA